MEERDEDKRRDGQEGMSRRDMVKAIGLGAVSLAAGCALPGVRQAAATGAVTADGPKQPPNILFILTDQEQHFDRYPSGFRLPGRERLMRDGVTFTSHQINTAVCTPSRSVILTGRHIQHTRMFDNSNLPWVDNMSTDIPTIGHLLRKAGYYTVYQGKWHLHKGMEESNVPGGELADPAIMEGYGFSDYVGAGDIIGGTLGGYHFDHFVANTARTWLRRKGQSLNAKGQPWFMTVGLVNPHDVMYYNTDLPGENVQSAGHPAFPINRAPRHALYQQKWDMPLSPTRKQPWGQPGRPPAHLEYQTARQALVGQFPNEDARWRRLQDYYLNCIMDCDRSVDALLRELDDLGLMQNTVVVLTSDHGELCGAHGMHGKGATAFREQNQVPLIISHPAFRGGKRCGAVTSHLDLVPTMLGLAGAGGTKVAATTNGLEGKDLTPLLAASETAGTNAVREGALYCYNMLLYLDAEFISAAMAAIAQGKKPTRKPDLSKRGAIRTVFDGRYKFSRYFALTQHNRPETMAQILALNDLELFDLQEDPNEAHNLAVDARRNGELVLAMNAKLNALIDGEVGEDVGQMLPRVEGIDWAVTRFDA